MKLEGKAKRAFLLKMERGRARARARRAGPPSGRFTYWDRAQKRFRAGYRANAGARRRRRRNPTLAQYVEQQGGIRTSAKRSEELAEVPLRYRRRSGQALDTMLEGAKARGLLPASADEDTLIEALKGRHEADYEHARKLEQLAAEQGEYEALDWTDPPVKSVRVKATGAAARLSEWRASPFRRNPPPLGARKPAPKKKRRTRRARSPGLAELELAGASCSQRWTAARRENPDLLTISNPRAMTAAAKAYRTFHGVEPKRASRIGRGNGVLISLGELREIVYQPKRGHRKGPAFFHRFGKGARLAATPDGKQLFVIPSKGGKAFKVDWKRGIVG